MNYCNNLLSTISFYDTERQPVNARGYFKKERIYDENNNVKENFYYDTEGRQISEQIFMVQILSVSGAALGQGVPIGSVILQYNELENAYQPEAAEVRRKEKNNSK